MTTTDKQAEVPTADRSILPTLYNSTELKNIKKVKIHSEQLIDTISLEDQCVELNKVLE